MRLVHAYRACKLLYDFIVSNDIVGKVLLPANVCSDVVETITEAGAMPEFVDIDKSTLCMDEQEALKGVSYSKALLFVHTYGVESDYESFFRRAKDANPEIAIIDDKCLCWPDLNTDFSTEADLVLYSTGAKKQLDLGGGGYGLLKCSRIDSKRGFGNSVLLNNEDPVGCQSIDHYHHVLSHRNTISKIYGTNLPSSIQLPKQFQKWRFNIVVNNKEDVLKALFANGLYASGHYKPLKDNCPNAKWLYDHIVNLFEDGYYTEEQAIKTCKVINDNLVV